MISLDSIQQKAKSLLEGTQPKVSIGVVGVLLILAGFWAYSNFTTTTKDNDVEQVTVQTSRESLGSISGGAVGPKGDSNTDGTVAGVSVEIAAESQANRKKQHQRRYLQSAKR